MQHKILANTNLEEKLKKQLFGFSENCCLNNNKNNDLVIEDHPIKGKSVISREKY